jgi:hypothetical protein
MTQRLAEILAEMVMASLDAKERRAKTSVKICLVAKAPLFALPLRQVPRWNLRGVEDASEPGR